MKRTLLPQTRKSTILEYGRAVKKAEYFPRYGDSLTPLRNKKNAY